MNRFFRRMQRFGKKYSDDRSHGLMRNMEHEVHSASTPQDVEGARTKSARHKKVTADKWNQ
jgi:hypothetical protein